MKDKIAIILTGLFCAIILAFSLRGIAGNPTSNVINNTEWKENGPFELSPERGHFALALSVIENRSLYYSLPIARFATPDLGFANGHYVSLFAPALSFIILPGFLLGNLFHIGQVGAYAVIAFFAVINVLLIRGIAKLLGVHHLAATISGLIFLFATPAFAYGVNLYQHHISTFLILASLYLLMRFKGIVSLACIWLLFAASIPVDYPNLFLMFPIAIVALGRFILVKNQRYKIQLTLKLKYLLSFLGIVLPLLFFMWFSKVSYDNPFQLAGTVATVSSIDESGNPAAPREASENDLQDTLDPSKQHKSAVRFFDTRALSNGFYIHFVSPDRGILYYTPIMFFGFVGIIIAFKKKTPYLSVLLGILGIDLLLYSLWGDPWGGWAFGSRYLIPGYAVLSIFIALLFTHAKRKSVVALVSIPFVLYSIAVNTLGAITTSALPPQIQVLSLEEISGIEQKYTYEKNWDIIRSGESKSFVFRTFLKDSMTALQFYQLLVASLSVSLIGLFAIFVISSRKKGAKYVSTK